MRTAHAQDPDTLVYPDQDPAELRAVACRASFDRVRFAFGRYRDLYGAYWRVCNDSRSTPSQRSRTHAAVLRAERLFFDIVGGIQGEILEALEEAEVSVTHEVRPSAKVAP